MQTLYQNVLELVSATSMGMAITPTEKLARTQALFMYLVIALFLDGDVSLRKLAEREMERMTTWLGELCKIRENLGDGDGDDQEIEWEVGFSRLLAFFPLSLGLLLFSADWWFGAINRANSLVCCVAEVDIRRVCEENDRSWVLGCWAVLDDG